MIKGLLTRLVLAGLLPLIWYVRSGRGDAQRHSRRFRFCAEFLSLIPFELGILARKLYYERTLARCGGDLMVFLGAMFVNPGTMVGDRLEVRPYSMVGLAEIGNDVSLAQRVSVLSGPRQHSGLTKGGEQARTLAERIRIGSGAWVGAHAVVMADVGEGSVVGAGAVVVKPVPPYSVAAGVPARVVGGKSQAASTDSGDVLTTSS